MAAKNEAVGGDLYFRFRMLLKSAITHLLFIRNSKLLGVCDLSLGGSTEPPEPPLDLPQIPLVV